MAELLKQIKTDSIQVDNDAIRLVDVRTSNNLNQIGEIRIHNPDGSMDNSFNVDDDITVSIGLDDTGEGSPTKIFTGVIQEIEVAPLLYLRLQGSAIKLKKTTYKKSYNVVSPRKVLGDILTDSGVKFELGNIPDKVRHTHICPNRNHLVEIQRVNVSYDLGLIPYFNREGVLILKTFDEAVTKTDIIYEDGEFKKFDQGILECLLDLDSDIFNEIEILGINYIITDHRFFLDDRRTKSFITVAKA